MPYQLGVSLLSGFDFDCGGAAIWACNTTGIIFHLGQSNCNSATGIAEDVLSNGAIYAFPNPSGDVFRLNKELDGYLILDVFGNIIRSVVGRTASVDLTSLPAGVYFLKSAENKTIRLLKL